MVKISVIIVLYNEFELVKTSIASIYENGFKAIEIILSDNSTDKEGYKKVLSKFPKVKYVKNKKDLGFAGGVNSGIKHAKGQFILIFTPDMYLLPGTISKTLKYLEDHKKVALVGCPVMSSPKKQEPSILSRYPGFITQLYYYNMPLYKLIARVSMNFQPLYLPIAKHNKIVKAKAVSGQYMLIRYEALREIGYFDTRFFLYFEDIDLCKRLIERGWDIVYLPIGGVVQNGMSDWKEKVRITQSLAPYMKSLYKFFGKHYGKFYLLVAFFLGVTSALMSVPYLYITYAFKKTLGLSSQAKDLLPLWLKITKWHLTQGLKLISHL